MHSTPSVEPIRLAWYANSTATWQYWSNALYKCIDPCTFATAIIPLPMFSMHVALSSLLLSTRDVSPFSIFQTHKFDFEGHVDKICFFVKYTIRLCESEFDVSPEQVQITF